MESKCGFLWLANGSMLLTQVGNIRIRFSFDLVFWIVGVEGLGVSFGLAYGSMLLTQAGNRRKKFVKQGVIWLVSVRGGGREYLCLVSGEPWSCVGGAWPGDRKHASPKTAWWWWWPSSQWSSQFQLHFTVICSCVPARFIQTFPPNTMTLLLHNHPTKLSVAWSVPATFCKS